LILIGVALAAGITVAAASAIYAAYKIVSSSVGFIEGLFTGDSYQSENIDSVIALNKEVKTRTEQGSKDATGRPPAVRRPCLCAQRSPEGCRRRQRRVCLHAAGRNQGGTHQL